MSRMPPLRIRDGMASGTSGPVHAGGRVSCTSGTSAGQDSWSARPAVPCGSGRRGAGASARTCAGFRGGLVGVVCESVAARAAPLGGGRAGGVRGNWGNPGLSSFWGVRVSGPVAASISDAPPPCENEQPARANVVCVGYLPIEWAVRSTRVYPEAVTNKSKSVVEPPAGRSEQGWFRVPL